MGDGGPILNATRWTGFIAGVLTLALGIVHLCKIGAKLSWPNDFTSDSYAQDNWRRVLFTFIPDLFIDIWQPFVFGLLICMCHVKGFNVMSGITSSCSRYLVFMLIAGLFGGLGYNGGLGIIAGTVSLVSAFLALLAFLIEDGDASLKFDIGLKEGAAA